MSDRVAVIGAGVIGLSIAHQLAAEGRDVTVLADADPLETTSAVAGAVWFPYAAERSATVDAMLAVTLERFLAIAADHPAAGIDLRSGVIVERSPESDRSWTAWVDATEVDASELPVFRLPDGVTSLRTTVPLATMSLYLPWLRERCVGLGVRFERRAIDDVDALARAFDVAVVAAGVRSGSLLGDDASVVPIRGQVVRVENPGVTEFVIDDEDPAGLTYVLPRRDCLVLGGTHEAGATSLEPDPATEAAILERCARLVPAVAGQRIVSRGVGLRPGRERLRIEDVRGRALRTIAAYGHGGSGMTLSWGTAERVAALLA
ncbi:FAD-dependent oxidoreductase [Agrococcus sp. Marseille-Q4369]|uniref:FAD-dependent oxidoreductase n=1 Tax=Agrococcus sp. Marseille-Q4369 TaxID=2810513 RepID=UPI001B8C8EFF|nr:FAD-dependent oxidoreductase [Agrococcus sp. Marseille-Q4369]QUW18119.1 FAD-dependent oxidoreductase [Agrococcus sp. Marseille-Q4369]